MKKFFLFIKFCRRKKLKIKICFFSSFGLFTVLSDNKANFGIESHSTLHYFKLVTYCWPTNFSTVEEHNLMKLFIRYFTFTKTYIEVF